MFFSGSGGIGYYLRNDPPGKDDLIIHEYFALVHGDYGPDKDGEVNYHYDEDLAATWIKIATELSECSEQKSTQAQKKELEQVKSAELVTKGVLSRNQAITRTINLPESMLKRTRPNRMDLGDCLKSDEQKRKEDAERWLKVI